MEPEIEYRDQVIRTLEEIQGELKRLNERVSALEALAAEQSQALNPIPAGDANEALSEELVLIISGAIAAFLGEKPRIRQIRLLGSESWSQQGRATIQASHALRIRRD